MTNSVPPSPASSSHGPRRGEVVSDLYDGFQQGGAIGMFERVADRMGRQMEQDLERLYTSENLGRVANKILDSLPPEWADGIKQLFNMLSGGADNEAEPSAEAQMGAELYGAGGAQNERVRYNAAMEQRNDEGFAAGVTIGSGAGGAILEVNGRKVSPNGKEEGDDAVNEFSEGMEAVTEEQKRQRELDEWQGSKHSYFGAELTGEEWGNMADELRKDGKVRQSLISRMMQDGKPRAEAEAKANEMADTYDILRKPESQWTDDEKRQVGRANQDPDYQKYTQQVHTSIADAKAPEQRVAANAGQPESIKSRSDVFASAPDLTAHHRNAVAATEPLDATPNQVKVAVAPPPPPQPSVSGGFDV